MATWIYFFIFSMDSVNKIKFYKVNNDYFIELINEDLINSPFYSKKLTILEIIRIINYLYYLYYFFFFY